MVKFDPKKYAVTLKLVFLKAVYEIFPDIEVEIEHSLNNGTYGTVTKGEKITEEGIKKIDKKMQEIIKKDYPILLVCQDNDVLKSRSNDILRKDIRVLLENSGWTGMMEYEINGYFDFVYEEPYPSTGNVKLYEISLYNGGFLIKYPTKAPDELPPYIDNPKMAKVFQETGQWNNILDISTIGTLNEKILKGEIPELIRINEALHHKNISKIADQITENKDIKLVTIAGPSSSGKTTFSKRLYLHLRANEITPIIISLDDYYIGRKNVPLDEDGNKDYETIEALDLELLNENLRELVAGKEVEIPEYNFVSGEREKTGKLMKVPEHGLIIIEGIHGLNEKLTASIPKKNKFKIYISCLTQLNIDRHNRIATSDVRKIRRLVRDSMARNTFVEETIAMWNSVRKGEEKYIFPFQEDADVMFNSNLVYELGVLKRYAIRELIKIKVDSPYYEEAKRLMKFLYCFVDIDSKYIPDDSILKEFIGDSIFYKY
ncbi:nucleoside kinase [Fusobacterium sp.]|uniref:uridine kinase family protein n=1 Tax=Fusobacterium sp. TaxID=68766 RepID=UPI0029031886|nr:nucleoside kinase [Fusobacterium sp.]MDU1911401.1 nucleoside kinase [Fusobacterium sp.]